MALYTLDETGLSVAGWAEAQEEVLKAYTAAPEAGGFGASADVSPDSPFYKIASPCTRQTASVLQALRDLTAQFDPASAFGLQLDRLGSLIGLRRRGATRSTIIGRAVGTPGTPLIAGASFRYLPTGSRWQLAADATIGLSGQVDVTLFALDFGPVDAPSAPATDWQIVTGQVLGWTSFHSTESAQLGALRETDVEYRARFADAAQGLCTYDAIVNRLRLVTNVTSVYLYVNKALAFDVTLQLEGKQMRAVVQGGLKASIITALHASLGAPVDTAGAVTGTVDPGNGQVLDYAYDRLRRRRCLLRLTITGGNPAAPLPANAADIALEAVAAVTPVVGPFIPMLFGLAAVQAILAVKPGSVTGIVAEGRLDAGDPWVEGAITLGIAEVASVSVAPTAAVAVADTDAPVVLGGDEFRADVDGGGVQVVSYSDELTSGSADVAIPLAALTGVTVEVVDGLITITTDTIGSTASIALDGGSATAALFDDPTFTFTGADADATIVIVP